MVGLFQTTLINRQCFELGSKGLLVRQLVAVVSSADTDGF